MAQYSMKSGSPAHSWKENTQEVVRGSRKMEEERKEGKIHQNISYSVNANVSAGSIKRAEQQKLDICEEEGESERGKRWRS